MKNLLIFIACGMVLFTSCSKDSDTAEDFIGIWAGDSICDETEAVVLELTTTNTDGELNILFTDDDITFNDDFSIKGSVDNGQLLITNQIVNEGGEFDVLTFDGSGVINEAGELVITLTHQVDGESQMCTLQLAKR